MSSLSSSAHLEVLSGPLQGKLLSLAPPQTVVGREVEDDGSLSLSLYREVSRRHARFYVKNGIWCVEDLGSTNGTFVNGVRAAPSFSLNDGVVVQMGDFRARLRLSAQDSSSPLPGATQYSPYPNAGPYPQPGAPMPVTPLPVAPMPIAPVVPYPAYPVVYSPPKSVALAIVFSVLLVGGGQFYNGETNKGLSMLCGAIVCGFLSFFTCGLTAIGGTILWILSIVDAAQGADRINRAANFPPSF